MSIEKLMDLLKDNEMLAKIKSFDSIDDVQKLLASKNIDVPTDQLKGVLDKLKSSGGAEGLLDNIKDGIGKLF